MKASPTASDPEEQRSQPRKQRPQADHDTGRQAATLSSSRFPLQITPFAACIAKVYFPAALPNAPFPRPICPCPHRCCSISDAAKTKEEDSLSRKRKKICAHCVDTLRRRLSVLNTGRIVLLTFRPGMFPPLFFSFPSFPICFRIVADPADCGASLQGIIPFHRPLPAFMSDSGFRASSSIRRRYRFRLQGPACSARLGSVDRSI
ncbi:hypothetical protein N658DRAFT_244658 [Parathielavia hyrcaniae]|uniref:Uncharacterized protein n=1 Tax=Parathielavia hyrcaniae TaxID=113614 RepID=A0AAN6Q5V7_9PEZI|nr:hypothetical protein N658DRAFT_244658 [Parathielavia hyrcaniae]